MGNVHEGRSWDTKEVRRNAPIRKLLKRIGKYPGMSPRQKAKYQAILESAVSPIKESTPPEAIGWGLKHPIMAFFVDIFLEAYPDARVIHLVRDGRDVMLSGSGQVSRSLKSGRKRDQLMVFGEENVESYKGLDLPAAGQVFRPELEMLYWNNATSHAIRGRSYGSRYLEVKYEDLCHEPIATLSDIFEFLHIPMPAELHQWAANAIHAGRIGKWKERQTELEAAIAVGLPMLEALSYIDPVPSSSDGG